MEEILDTSKEKIVGFGDIWYCFNNLNPSHEEYKTPIYLTLVGPSFFLPVFLSAFYPINDPRAK